MSFFRNKKQEQRKFDLSPSKNFSLNENSFIGALFKPEKNLYPQKAVIILGGTEGNFELTKFLAEQYTKNGITTMAVAYFNEPGLPDHFENNPIEYIENAAKWLENNGYPKVGIWGISKGAELALISASLMPNLISSVVVVCPINIIPQGFSVKKLPKTLNCSSWSWRGKKLPWGELQFDISKVLFDSLRKRSPNLRSCYESSILQDNEDCQIKVENINGPILLITPEFDPMWPSEIAARKIMKRLDEKKFEFSYNWLSYQFASHILVPIELSMSKAFAIERKFPKECWKSKQDSLKTTLAFWKKVW